MLETLGKRLAHLRNDRGWTQQDVADKLQISRGTYAHWEIDKREPDISTLIQLADLFAVSVDYLAGRTEFVSEQNIAEMPRFHREGESVNVLEEEAFIEKLAEKIADRLSKENK